MKDDDDDEMTYSVTHNYNELNMISFKILILCIEIKTRVVSKNDRSLRILT